MSIIPPDNVTLDHCAIATTMTLNLNKSCTSTPPVLGQGRHQATTGGGENRWALLLFLVSLLLPVVVSKLAAVGIGKYCTRCDAVEASHYTGKFGSKII